MNRGMYMNSRAMSSMYAELVHEEFEFVGLDDLATRVQEIKLGGTYKIRITYGKKDYDKKFPKIKCLGIKAEPEQLPFDV